jgi:hypothetical protein
MDCSAAAAGFLETTARGDGLLLLVGLALFGGYWRKRPEKAIHFNVGASGEEQRG